MAAAAATIGILGTRASAGRSRRSDSTSPALQGGLASTGARAGWAGVWPFALASPAVGASQLTSAGPALAAFGTRFASGIADTHADVRGGHNLIEKTLDSDLSLVSRCLRGDEPAWEELVRVHTRKVYSLCYRFTNSGSEAQDLTQEVFLRVFRTLKTFRAAEGSFATWLARVTRNLLIDHYRRTRQERVTDSIEGQLPVIEEAGAGAPVRPDQALAGREASEILQATLQRLSPDLREAVILRDLQEMEYREIAGVLGIPEGTVKSRINRGRAELARLLRKQKLAV